MSESLGQALPCEAISKGLDVQCSFLA